MPRENKKRGRRGEEKKRKLEETADENRDQQKRQKTSPSVDGDALEDQHDFHALENGAEASHDAIEKPFFGMLDDDEQEYFRKADEMLELNDFAEPEERNLFLANVYREAEGKELKIANSQSCSRLMERLIQLSTPYQLKKLFQRFNGNFMHLIQHRFASHCCEKLFTKSAPFVSEELLHPEDPEAASVSNGDVYVSMESLFLYTVGELEGSIGFLMTDRFASHALRVLLLVLAGEPLSATTNKSLLQSKKKETVAVNGIVNGDQKEEEKHAVPDSFTEALQKLMSDSVAGLDTNSLRALATHQLGNPTLQLLIRLELSHFGKQRAKETSSVIRTLLPDDPITEDSDSAAFLNGLLFDSIGSHLMETIIEYAPGKLFKNLYKDLLKDRMGSLARNEVAGYVVCKILERLSKEDLVAAHELIVPQIPGLLERDRLTVVKTLMQRLHARDVDTQTVALQLDTVYQGANGFDILKLLKLDEASVERGDSVPAQAMHAKRSDAQVHGAVLAQTMILIPGPLSALVFDSFTNVSPEMLVEIATNPVTSRTLQAAMTSTNASIISRRKLVQQFYGKIGSMAEDRYASRVVDAIWEGTHGLAFIRERIAEELGENEGALRESPSGRAVWKNWKMDLYKRRRAEWIQQSKNKASNDGFQSFSEVDKNKQQAHDHVQNGEGKTALQLARERHATNKARKSQASIRRTANAGNAGTGANATATAAM